MSKSEKQILPPLPSGYKYVQVDANANGEYPLPDCWRHDNSFVNSTLIFKDASGNEIDRQTIVEPFMIIRQGNSQYCKLR